MVPNRSLLDPFGVAKPPSAWLSPSPAKAAIARRSLRLNETGATCVGAKTVGQRGRRGGARDHDPDHADGQPGPQRHSREPHTSRANTAPAGSA